MKKTLLLSASVTILLILSSFAGAVMISEPLETGEPIIQAEPTEKEVEQITESIEKSTMKHQWLTGRIYRINRYREGDATGTIIREDGGGRIAFRIGKDMAEDLRRHQYVKFRMGEPEGRLKRIRFAVDVRPAQRQQSIPVWERGTTYHARFNTPSADTSIEDKKKDFLEQYYKRHHIK
ncbi:hypothetical protein GF371_02900 [Candidatus Woesearchaeota archaeon]|nr:hypothetical protein [Candidatus Woesearchaeota archaeon]